MHVHTKGQKHRRTTDVLFPDVELTWARIYHQRQVKDKTSQKPKTSQKMLDTRQLTQNEEHQESYREQIKQETESREYVAAQQMEKAQGHN